jgi:hypothetical protein
MVGVLNLTFGRDTSHALSMRSRDRKYKGKTNAVCFSAATTTRNEQYTRNISQVRDNTDVESTVQDRKATP